MKLPKRLKVCVTLPDILTGQVPGQQVRAESCPIARATHTALRKILGNAHPDLIVRATILDLSAISDDKLIAYYSLSKPARRFLARADMLQESPLNKEELEPATFYFTLLL